MQEMVNIYVYGKKYSVPGDLTIMTAMEYAGYQLKRGCGCRHGFCGACVLSDRQENIRYRRDQRRAESHDGSVSGNLQLRWM